MLYDLNLAWSPATTQDQLLRLLSLASSLGYGTVALSHTVTLPFPANPTSPLPTLESLSAASPTSSSSVSAPKLPHVLHRATLPLSDPAASNYRLPALAGVYDILAIRPLTEKAFQNACLTLDIPLISLDLTQHFPFHFRPKPCMAAVTRGVRFEICYSQVLAADTRGRASFIGNATNLIRATRGRGIVISSEARSALGLRGPADVVNLLHVWGLPSEKGMEGLGSVARSVVVNEGMKRNGFRGVIEVVQVAGKDGAEGKNASGPNPATPKQGENQAGAPKRKTEDGQTLSKRQAKKAKRASMAKTAASSSDAV